EWRDDDITPGLHGLVVIHQSKPRETGHERSVTFLAHAANLQIRAAGQVDQSVAVTQRKLRDACCLDRRQSSAARTQAHDKAITREHRTQRRWAPALDREGLHDASRSEATMELRRVTQSEASSRRRKHPSSAASATGFSRARNPRISSLPSVA